MSSLKWVYKISQTNGAKNNWFSYRNLKLPEMNSGCVYFSGEGQFPPYYICQHSKLQIRSLC